MTDPSPKLVTIPNVEICEVGEEWELSTGPLTITPEHISKFLAGIENDSAVHAPRIRFGHTDDWPVASEPAFGRYTNLRATNAGQTLVGDIAGVPAWFAEIAPAAWPNRSLDGWEDATTHTGNKYPLLIDAVSFLGVKLPGINTLEDLAAVWAGEPPEGTTVEAGTPITATRGGAALAKPVAAAVGTTDLLKAFYNDFAQGDRYWWWIRQTFLDPTILIVDDDEGSLWALEYSISGDAVEFGEPYEVVTQYVNKENGQVAAALAERLQTGGQAAAVYASAADSRPQDRKKEDDVGKPTNASTATVDKAALLKKLGLPEDASEEDITAALAAEETPDPAPTPDPADEPDEDEADADDDEDDEDESEGDETTATRTVPAAEWKSTQERLAAHDKRAKDDEAKRRAGVVSAAVKEGRVSRAHAKAWLTKFEVDPEGTEKLLTATEDKGGLPKNMVPVDEMGVQTGDEVDATGLDAAQEAYYATHFPELATAGKE